MLTSDNMSSVLLKLMRLLKVPVTETAVLNELQKHPQKDSLLAINDILNQWKVPNEAFKISFQNLFQVPVPFVTMLSSNVKEFVLVESMDADTVTIYNERFKSFKVASYKFEKNFTGAVLVAQADEEAGDPNYSYHRRTEILSLWRNPLLFAAILILLVFTFWNKNNLEWLPAGLFICKLFGLAMTVLLLVQSLDSNNALIQKFCSKEKNKNCNHILSSSAAWITPDLSWSEVGFFYFSGTLLTLIYTPDGVPLMQILALLNVVGLPYTFYSVYYQSRAGHWCIFCTTVQIILWLEFMLIHSYLNAPWNIQFSNILLPVLTSFILPVLFWCFMKPYFKSAFQARQLIGQVDVLKYNRRLFQKVLTDGRQHPLPADRDVIVLGNPLSANVITIISNPFCRPCSTAHQDIHEWIEKNADIKVQVVFEGQTIDEDHKRQVASHLISYCIANEGDSRAKALHDWYSQDIKSYQKWSNQYPLSTNPTQHLEILANQKAWVERTRIKLTPTVLLNGYEIPGPWRLKDIKYLL